MPMPPPLSPLPPPLSRPSLLGSPATPASSSSTTAASNTSADMIKAVRALYADKKEFSHYKPLNVNKVFYNIATLRTQLGFAEDVPVIAAKGYEVTVLNDHDGDHDKVVRTTSLLAALFQEGLEQVL